MGGQACRRVPAESEKGIAMLKSIRNARHAIVGAALSAPVVVFAQAAPYEAAFTAVETEFTALLPVAYATMGVVTVGLIIFALVKRLARSAAK